MPESRLSTSPPVTLNIKGIGKNDLYGIKAVLHEMIEEILTFFSNEFPVLFNKFKNRKLVLHNYEELFFIIF